LLEPLSIHPDGRGGSLADPARSDGASVGDLKNFHSLVPHAQNVFEKIKRQPERCVVAAGSRDLPGRYGG
jgi:hypothetical protein